MSYQQLTEEEIYDLSIDTCIPEDEIITALNLNKKEDEKLLKEIRKTSDIKNLYLLAFKAKAGSEARKKAFEKWLSILEISAEHQDPFYWTLKELVKLWNYVPNGSDLDKKVVSTINQICLKHLEDVSTIEECSKIYKFTTENSKARKECILKAVEIYKQLTFSF